MPSNYHSPLGASNAEQWLHCPASPWLGKLAPNKGSDAAARGTRIHALADGQEVAAAEDEVAVAERFKAALAGVAQGPYTTEIEVDGLHPLFRTHADAAWTFGDRAYIVDLKTGHAPITFPDNAQLLVTAAAMQTEYRDVAAWHLGIYQERGDLDPWRWQILTAAEVRGWAVAFTQAAERAAEGGHHPVTGEHCFRCRGQGSCSAYAATQSMPVIDPTQMPPTVLAEWYKQIPKAKRFLDKVAETAMDLAEAGFLPGARIVPGKAKPRVWTNTAPDAVFRNLPMTPAQAIKEKVLDKETVERLSTRPPSAPKLILVGQTEDVL